MMRRQTVNKNVNVRLAARSGGFNVDARLGCPASAALGISAAAGVLISIGCTDGPRSLAFDRRNQSPLVIEGFPSTHRHLPQRRASRESVVCLLELISHQVHVFGNLAAGKVRHAEIFLDGRTQPQLQGFEHELARILLPEAPTSKKWWAIMASKSARDVPDSGRWKIGSRAASSRVTRSSDCVSAVTEMRPPPYSLGARHFRQLRVAMLARGRTKPVNSGCPSRGVEVNSGWNCVATNHG